MTRDNSAPPLAKRLSLRDGQRVWFDAMPEAIMDEIDEYALELHFVAGPKDAPDASHLFVTDRAALASKLAQLRETMAQDGHVWVSWKRHGSELSEEDVRDAALGLGFIETRTFDLDEIWSAMKFAIRKDLRA